MGGSVLLDEAGDCLGCVTGRFVANHKRHLLGLLYCSCETRFGVGQKRSERVAGKCHICIGSGGQFNSELLVVQGPGRAGL